jgi:hypothetical protein
MREGFSIPAVFAQARDFGNFGDVGNSERCPLPLHCPPSRVTLFKSLTGRDLEK